MATYEGLVKLGTLRNGSIVKPRPTLPWRITSEPYSGAGVGNIADFSTDPVMANWNIGDTDANDANKLQWHKIKDGAKTLLICDRVILVNVSWDDLHSDNRVYGKTITIDGQQYKLRLLTAGAERREGGTGSSYGGGKLPNEWDRFITNEDAIAGIPIPAASDLDATLNATDKNSAHNQFWNWMGVYTWAQQAYTANSAYRAVRGDLSARYWIFGASSVRYSGIGWRPVLEVLNTATSVTLTSPANNQTLTEGKTYSIAGSATDPDNGNVVTIKYKINNGTARAINSGVSDGSTPIAFSKNLTYRNKRLWDGSTDVVGYDLAEGTNHTLYVWAEDDQGGKSPDTTRSFTVIWNRPPVISGTDKNLGTISAPPSQDFSVTDPEGNPFTIEYYLDDQRFNSFPGVSGKTYTVSLTNDQWIRTSLAQHKLKVRAIDNQGAYSDRIFTFTRTDDRINFTLNYANTDIRNFFTTDQRANRILVTLDAVIPSGATLLVEACNNAYDDTPTWEDITAQAQAGRGYIFTNTTSTSGQWGINIRIQILKGSATETVLLNGFGGAFD